MLARQHVNLGVMGTVAAAYGLAAIGNAHLGISNPDIDANLISLISPVTLAILVVIGAAYAIIPDLDHPGSTVSRKFGFLSRGVSHIFGSLTGGHREASHSLFFSLICGFIGLGIVLIPIEFTIYNGVVMNSEKLFTGIIFVTSVMFIIKLVLPMGIGKRYYTMFVLASIVLASTFAINDLLPHFGLAFAMFMGVNLHVLGDACTPSGVKWLWPAKTVTRLHINGKTGQWRELNVIQPIFILGSAAAIAFAIVIPLVHTISDTANQAVALIH